MVFHQDLIRTLGLGQSEERPQLVELGMKLKLALEKGRDTKDLKVAYILL